jgi:hypothetical protein
VVCESFRAVPFDRFPLESDSFVLRIADHTHSDTKLITMNVKQTESCSLYAQS